MNAAQQALFNRLSSFEFDEPGTELTFARRLARENGWSVAYAGRVIEEYRRFLYLACATGHVVTPSEQVDQAWHLHLTYTRSYWDDLCRNVLRQPLHHGPTKGGNVEQEKFVDLYELTLTSYRQHFGEEPPSDVWSPADRRFGEDLRCVRVNTQRYWVIPKPRWAASLSQSRPRLALGLFGIPLAATNWNPDIKWNPLDWNGPPFLVAYVMLTFFAALFAYAVRFRWLVGQVTDEAKCSNPLDPYEAACLAGGPGRAVQAAVASMLQAGTLKIVGEESKVLGVIPRKRRLIAQGNPLPDDSHPLELALYRAAAKPVPDLVTLIAAGMPLAKKINQDLVDRGLLQGGSPPAHNLVSSLVMAAPLLLGVTKIAVGLSRGRPVANLVTLCVLTFAAAIGFLLVRARLSTAGKRTLESLKLKHSTIKQLASGSAETIAPPDLGMAIGLFGIGVLSAVPSPEIYAILRPAYARDGSGSSGGIGPLGGGCGGDGGGGGCGGGGCGGGGCGGGGCGGGGCGGCGGS